MESKHKRPTVSIITRCKGRKKTLQQTLPFMLMQDYDLTEVIVVNYNSPDKLSTWLQDEYGKFIKAGKLIETFVPDTHYFKHSHSRNVGLMAAKGDWVLYLDADCKPVTHLVTHILKRIGMGPDVFAMIGNPAIGKSGTMMARREDLISIGGFMEHLKGWGYEDGDVRDRLFLYGKEMFSFFPNLVNVVAHEDYERWCYFEPPLNKKKDINWKEIERDNNFRSSKKYIDENGIIANKNQDWGIGGIYEEPKKRWIYAIQEDKNYAKQMIPSNLKGAHVLKFDKKTGVLLNEKEVLDKGCPQSYIDEAKRSKRIQISDKEQKFQISHNDNPLNEFSGKINLESDIFVDIPDNPVKKTSGPAPEDLINARNEVCKVCQATDTHGKLLHKMIDGIYYCGEIPLTEKREIESDCPWLLWPGEKNYFGNFDYNEAVSR